MGRSSTKTMLIVFIDIRSIVHHEFVPQGQTVNKKFYCEVLRRLRENIQRKRSDLWRVKNWFSTTTMHRVTEHSLFVSFSPTTCYRFRTHPTRQI
jgi:hypothetical protein